MRSRLAAGEPLDGVFVKMPTHQVIELLALGPADLAVIDTEHAAFGPAELDAMLAVADALGFPCLVRVAEPSRPLIQQALDGGATGVVVPHVDSPELATDVVRWSHYGANGRGFSGSTRASGWGTRTMADVIDAASRTTTVVVQLEDRAALSHLDDIVNVHGLDAALIGAADLTVALGHEDPGHPEVTSAIDGIIDAAWRVRLALGALAAFAEEATAWRRRGVALVCMGSDQTRIRGP